MRDVMMLVLIAGFFAMCVAYVAWCDRIIGPDSATTDPAATGMADGQHDVAGQAADEVAAS